VFQHYALFRHMTVFENIAFGLRARPRRYRHSDQEIRKRVDKLLDLVQIGWLRDRYPRQLSGGQRQRVALARALAIEPRVLLLDEPFGALDAKVRKELRRWLRNLHNEIHVTSIFVTHDQEEALEVADRIVVMDKGRIQQAGTPQQVYDHPQTPAVHEFIGESIVVPVTVEAGDVQFRWRGAWAGPAGCSERSGAAVCPAARSDHRADDRRASSQGRRPAHSRHRPGPARRGRVGRRGRRDPDRGRCDALAATARRTDGRPAAGSIPAVPGRALRAGRAVEAAYSMPIASSFRRSSCRRLISVNPLMHRVYASGLRGKTKA
jgi:ABC-type Fe3+/spermidine/putrescine transport system ATPase subunit